MGPEIVCDLFERPNDIETQRASRQFYEDIRDWLTWLAFHADEDQTLPHVRILRDDRGPGHGIQIKAHEFAPWSKVDRVTFYSPTHTKMRHPDLSKADGKAQAAGGTYNPVDKDINLATNVVIEKYVGLRLASTMNQVRFVGRLKKCLILILHDLPRLSSTITHEFTHHLDYERGGKGIRKSTAIAGWSGQVPSKDPQIAAIRRSYDNPVEYNAYFNQIVDVFWNQLRVAEETVRYAVKDQTAGQRGKSGRALGDEWFAHVRTTPLGSWDHLSDYVKRRYPGLGFRDTPDEAMTPAERASIEELHRSGLLRRSVWVKSTQKRFLHRLYSFWVDMQNRIKSLEVKDKSLETQQVPGRVAASGRLDKPESVVAERYGGAEKEREVWYHGTCAKFIPQIMSAGLVPTTKQKTWDKGSSRKPFLTSLEGVYASADASTAWYTAQTAATKFRSDPAIIVMEVQPRSFWSDENWIVANDIRDIAAKSEDAQGFADDMFQIWQDENSNGDPLPLFSNPKLYKQVQAYLMSSYDSLIQAYEHRSRESDINEEWASWYRKFVDQLSRTLKDSSRLDTAVDAHRSGRLDGPIGFSGSNRIVGVFVVQQDEGYVEFVYGKFHSYWADFVHAAREVGSVPDDQLDPRLPLLTRKEFEQELRDQGEGLDEGPPRPSNERPMARVFDMGSGGKWRELDKPAVSDIGSGSLKLGVALTDFPAWHQDTGGEIWFDFRKFVLDRNFSEQEVRKFRELLSMYIHKYSRHLRRVDDAQT